MSTIQTKKKFFMSYSEMTSAGVISCHKMQFESLKDLLTMKKHLEAMSCNEQSFQVWSELLIIEHVCT